MHIYRLCKKEYSKNLLQGEGGRLADGRWHTAGQRIVYCASSEALAVLELRVHLGRYIPHFDYLMHTIDVPNKCIESLPANTLAKGWNAVPHTAVSQGIGNEWLESGRRLALRVPSVHSQSDTNILLNPAHPDIRRVRILARNHYQFDHRLF
ncbi:MAG: RES family NAD+ phosphorylase [Woeseia sp.]